MGYDLMGYDLMGWKEWVIRNGLKTNKGYNNGTWSGNDREIAQS